MATMTDLPKQESGTCPTYLAPGLAGIGWDPRSGMWKEVMVEVLQCQSQRSGPPQMMSLGMGSSQG